jgi:hypothetical protein
VCIIALQPKPTKGYQAKGFLKGLLGLIKEAMLATAFGQHSLFSYKQNAIILAFVTYTKLHLHPSHTRWFYSVLFGKILDVSEIV